MSLVMMIGNFVTSDPSVAKFGYTVSTCCREEMVNRTKEVQEMTCSIMSFIGKFIRAPFNLSKIDILVLPVDSFPPYCMSNPGVLVFSEHEVCPVSDKTCMYYTRVVRKLIHEVLHMWMGNLISSVSWKYYWLIEGNIGTITQLVGSQMFPSWYSDWMTIYYDIQPAMDAESWMLNDLNRQIDQFNAPDFSSLAAQAIYFGKSAAVIRMITMVDIATYRFQISQFFNHKTEFGRALNLYEYPDSFIGVQRMQTMVESWRVLESYPLINVELCGTGRVTLHQTVFRRKSRTEENLPSDRKWKALLPVMYIELDAPKKVKTVFFETDGSPVLLQTVLKPFKLNWHQSGYYRVNYSKELWANLAKTIKEPKVLDPEDKANLLDDAFVLAEYGHIHHGVPLSLVIYLRDSKELHPLPWLTAAKHLERLYHRTLGSQVTYLLEFLVKLIVDSYLMDESLYVVNKQPILEVIRKVAILDFAGTFVVKEAIDRFNFMLKSFLEEEMIPLELKRVTFTHAFKGDNVDEELYEKVMARFVDEINIFKKIMLWTALVGVQRMDYMDRLWKLANEPDDPDTDSRFNLLVRLKILSTNPLSRDYLWPNVQERWSDYGFLPTQSKDNVRAILLNIIQHASDPNVLRDISYFGHINDDLDVTNYAIKVQEDSVRWDNTNYLLFVEEWLHLYIMNST